MSIPKFLCCPCPKLFNAYPRPKLLIFADFLGQWRRALNATNSPRPKVAFCFYLVRI